MTIGFANNQGGQITFPSASAGAEAAVRYVNESLGGIDGHPLKLSTCFVTTSEEEGQACAQKFVNDEKIPLVVFGSFFIGAQTFESTNGGRKPILMGNAPLPGDPVAENGYIFNGSANTIWGGLAEYAKQLNASNGAIVYPKSTPGMDALFEQLKAVGIKYKAVAYEPTASDVIAPLTAAGAQTAEFVVMLASNEQQCAVGAEGLNTLGVTAPVITTGSFCFTPGVAKTLGGESPHWTTIATQKPLSSTELPDVSAFQAAAEQAGLSENDRASTDAGLAWSLVMTATRFLNQAGGAEATPSGVAKLAKSFTGPMMLGSPTINCGILAEAKEPAVCGYQTLPVEYLGEGKYKEVGDWLSPPGVG